MTMIQNNYDTGDFLKNVKKHGIYPAIKQDIEQTSYDLECILSESMTIGLFGTAFLAATLAVNTAFLGAIAGIEGIERICGVSTKSYSATLKEKHKSRGPNGREQSYGVFKTKDGKEITVYDNPVVTEGTFLPYNFDKLQESKDYKIKIFGSEKIAPRLVRAEKIN